MLKNGLAKLRRLGALVETDGTTIYTHHHGQVDEKMLAWIAENKDALIDLLIAEAREPEWFAIPQSLMLDPITTAEMAANAGATELEIIAVLEQAAQVKGWAATPSFFATCARLANQYKRLQAWAAEGLYPPNPQSVAMNLAALGASVEEIERAITYDDRCWDNRNTPLSIHQTALRAVQRTMSYRDDYTWLTSPGVMLARWVPEPRYEDGPYQGYAAPMNVFYYVEEQPEYLEAGLESKTDVLQRQVAEAQEYISGKRKPRN